MNFGEAKAGFLASLKERNPEEHLPKDFLETAGQALAFVEPRFAGRPLEKLTPGELRDTLARWYVEEASAQIARQTHQASPQSVHPPEADLLIASLSAFFNWFTQSARGQSAQQLLAILSELQSTLPRAIELSVALLSYSATRGGAVQFPEFLTSFEAGGHSEYDIGASGMVGAIEGYFRVLGVEGAQVEAEDLITEERLYPIVFPEAIARLLKPNYLVNLEIVRTSTGWQIVNCGFAYPPHTEF